MTSYDNLKCNVEVNDNNDEVDDDNIEIYSDVNQCNWPLWKSIFGDVDEELKFQKFMSSENSLHVHFALALVATFSTIASALRVFHSSHSDEYIFFVSQRIVIVISIWVHLYAVLQKNFPYMCKPLPIDMVYLGDAVLLTYVVSYGAFIYGTSIAQGCDYSSSLSTLTGEGHVPLDSIISYIAMGMMFVVLLKCRHTIVVLVFLVIQMAIIVSVMSIMEPNRVNTLAALVVFVAQALVAYDYDAYSRRLHKVVINSKNSMQAKLRSDNEKVLMRMQATEMRFLIGNVAHDLKSPLQAISFELEMLKVKDINRSFKDSLLLLESICSFMLMTINRAIDYSKVTSGIGLEPTLEEVDVAEVLNWVKRSISLTMSSTVSIAIDPFPSDISQSIVTDKQWLMENLLCLAANAQKFVSSGDISFRYSLEKPDDKTFGCTINEPQKPMVLFEVIDSGEGIGKDINHNLFKLSQQADRHSGGTGLGLYSLSTRVTCLGGHCGHSPRLDGKSGTRFWFALPYVFVSSNSGLALREGSTNKTWDCDRSYPLSRQLRRGCSEPIRMTEGDNSSKLFTSVQCSHESARILLVEDSPLIRKTCTRMFLRERILVDVASNGLECVKKVIDMPHRYAVLLMDINMPVMDGLEATKRIRSWELNSPMARSNCRPTNCSKLIIIGISANSDSLSKQEALDAGVDVYIGKPLRFATIRKNLEAHYINLDDFKQ